MAAAGGGLDLTSSATYTLAPAAHVVRVAVELTAHNTKPSVTAGGILTKYFYEGARVAVQSEATNIRATSGGASLSVNRTAADGFALVDVRFRAAIFFQQTAKVHLTFDLPGGAPRSKSDIRVGRAFGTFVAWAFGDSGSVRVVVPAGFEAATTGSTVTKTASGGATVFRATSVTDVADWYLVVNADRKSALTSDRVDLEGGEHIVVRAWPEDAEWKQRVTQLLTSGLPELVEQTGLAWPVARDLTIFEVHTPLLEGYAGVFFQGQDRIEISEDLDELTILHEASHAWFNSELFDGRWIDEGLADTYASKALDGIGITGWAPHPVSPTDKAAVPLADWVHPGRISDDATEAREQYGYDAAWTVVRSIVTEVGDVRMRGVLSAAQAHQIAYVGAGAPETVAGSTDWRRLLDLLDETGKSKTADDLFRRWVLTAGEAATLDERAAARTAYAALAAAGGDWRVPFYVRDAMADWRFAEATARIDEAQAILAKRDDLAKLTTQLGVAPPPLLIDSYQTAQTSFDAANAIADRDIGAARALVRAEAAVAAPRAPFVALGLLGTTPEADLAAARSAFQASGSDAMARATAVADLIDGAVGVGRSRFVTLLEVVGLVVVLLVAFAALLWRRRASRRARLVAATAAAEDAIGPAQPAEAAIVAGRAAAGPTEVAEAATIAAEGAATEAPYATLADQSAEPAALDSTTIPSDAAAVAEATTKPRRRRRSKPAAASPSADPETDPASDSGQTGDAS